VLRLVIACALFTTLLQVRNEGVSGRDFSADDEGGLLVTLRSVAGTVQCTCALFGRVRLA
jgi:hypothetical protein